MTRGLAGHGCFLILCLGVAIPLTQWLWTCDPTAPPDTSGASGNKDSKVEEDVGNQQVGCPLSVLNSDLEYLTREEAEQIIARLESNMHIKNRLLFWTGLPRGWVQKWADEHDMLTLTSVMGPLMDVGSPQCAKNRKKFVGWSRYVKGASAIFSRYACAYGGVIRILTLPPSESWRLRQHSTYRTIEEPVLKGSVGDCYALQINFVHLMVESRAVEYQIWPKDYTKEGLGSIGSSSEFLLPPLPPNLCSNNAEAKKKKKKERKEKERKEKERKEKEEKKKEREEKKERKEKERKEKEEKKKEEEKKKRRKKKRKRKNNKNIQKGGATEASSSVLPRRRCPKMGQN